jgi:hypothetical protein
MIILDDYLDSLRRGVKLGNRWTNLAAALLNRSNGSVNYKLGNFIFARTEVLGLPKAGFEGRAERDRELFEEWHGSPDELHEVATGLRSLLGQTQFQPELGTVKHPVGFFRWLRRATDEELAAGAASRGEHARQLEDEVRTTSRVTITAREGQKSFQEAVLIDFVRSGGAELLESCPGCGHSRKRLNGDPILEVHHVVPFHRTMAMDPRWGVPLCNNCHEVAETGTRPDRKSLYANVLRVFPQLADRLRELKDAGKLSVLDAEQLRADGLDLEPRGRGPGKAIRSA